MAVNPTTSSTSAVSQLVQEAARSTRGPRSEETRPADSGDAATRTPPPERTTEIRAESAEKARPVVNTQGQTTGRLINETA